MIVNIVINYTMVKKGVSQRALAKNTGIRLATINEMCNNTTVMLPLKNLAKICEVLDCDITDILELKKEPS